MLNHNRGKKSPKNASYFCDFQKKKLPKVNSYTMGENSSNLVTLLLVVCATNQTKAFKV
jgi:hypothetical protein